ncbi:MAG: T9SS type A sorting domain-containing protein [bacterium]|nr:MAG: T9SS type A sorting domain-containing protein [bacterium]
MIRIAPVLMLLLIISAIPHSAAESVPNTTIGLYSDQTRCSSCVYIDNDFVPFDVWIYVKPGDDGLMCAEFSLEVPNWLILMGQEDNPLLSTVLGDPVSGVHACYSDCQTGWTWLFKCMFFPIQTNPYDYIIIEDHPESGGILAASCLPGQPTSEMTGNRYFGLNDCWNFTDNLPPRVVSLDVLDETSLRAVFDDLVDSETAQQPAHYLIEDVDIPGVLLVMDDVVLTADSSGVTLIMVDPFQEGVKYRMCLDGVCDRCGNCTVCESWTWKEFGVLAELVVESLGVEPDSIAPNETHMEASFIIRNTGDIDSGPFSVKLEFNAMNHPSGVSTVDQFSHPGLAPGESASLTRDFDIPEEKGEHNQLIITVDALEEVPELNEYNVIKPSFYTHRPVVGIMDPSTLVVSPSVVRDCCAHVEFSFSVENHGTWPSEPVTKSIGVGQYGGTVTWLCPYSVPALQPGDSITITTSGVITHALACGYNELWFDHNWGLVFSSDRIYNYTPRIVSIEDIPEDGGGAVTMTFYRSAADNDEVSAGVTHYRIMRRICDITGEITFKRAAVSDSSCYSSDEWEQVAIVEADRSNTYTVNLATCADSTVEHGMYWSVYYVIADRPATSYYSCPDSGYSNDDTTAVATLLESFDAKLNGTVIEVRWDISGEEPEGGFIVLKAQGNGLFERPDQQISRDENGPFIFRDNMIESGKQYRYRVVYDEDGIELILFETEKIRIPMIPTSLSQNWPNPFNPSTTIEYYISAPSTVSLNIFDVNGRLVKKLVASTMPAGKYSVKWDGLTDNDSPAASGIYFYRLKAGKDTFSKKMILLR